jgi:uncharacterized protein (TIGR03435 family)
MNRALREMLADRFQLKVRRETEQRPMYALTVAAGGLKIKPPVPGDCAEHGPDMPRMRPSIAKPYCGETRHTTPLARLELLMSGTDRETVNALPGPDRRIEYSGRTLQAIAEHLSHVMDRFVLDKTGVSGQFSFAFEYTRNESTPGASMGINTAQDSVPPEDRVRPAMTSGDQTIFQALQALGLKLVPTTGPAEYLVIDSAQKPRQNDPASPDTPTRAAGAGPRR